MSETTNPGPAPAFPKRPIAHVGYTVKDIAAGVDLWTRAFGAGPFFQLGDVEFDELEHDGAPAIFEHSTAFGSWGKIAVELWEIHRLDPVDSLGPRFGTVNQLNHVAYYVDDPQEEGDRLEALGFPLLVRAKVGEVELRLHDAPQLGHMIELQPQSDLTDRFQDGVAAAARDWDGTRPLREVREILPDL